MRYVSTSVYSWITYGLGKIYSKEEIDKAKQSPSFEREYNLKYLGRIGNVFHTKDIEEAIEKGRKYNYDPNTYVNNRMEIMVVRKIFD
jgi:hypothetical protein